MSASQPVGRSNISQYEMTSVQSSQQPASQQYAQSGQLAQPQPAYDGGYGNPVQNAMAVPGSTVGCTPCQKATGYTFSALSLAFGAILEGIGHQAFEGNRPFNSVHTRTGECMESFGGALLGMGVVGLFATIFWPSKVDYPNNAVQEPVQQA